MITEDSKKPNPELFAKLFTANDSETKGNIYRSMTAAGYSESSSRRGEAGLNQSMLKALYKRGVKLAEIGKTLNQDHVGDAIAGKLYTNMLSGNTKGNEAAKMLGSMVRFGAFKSDQTQVIVLGDLKESERASESALLSPVPALEVSDLGD